MQINWNEVATFLAPLLANLVTVAGAGSATYAIINWLSDNVPGGLSTRSKFYGSMALALILPPVAWGLEGWLGVPNGGTTGLLSSLVASWKVSQIIHREVTIRAEANVQPTVTTYTEVSHDHTV